MEKIYISGRISGLPLEVARKRFAECEARIREKYPRAEIYNPMKFCTYEPGKKWQEYMRLCLAVLDIPITDSKVHERADVKLLYALLKNPRIHYPADVRPMEALKAVNRYHPHTVIACYPAFKWEPAKQIGSDCGVDFQKLLRRVKRLIIVGNDHVHGSFSFMQIPHKTIHIPGLITRNEDRSADNIYVWEN